MGITLEYDIPAKLFDASTWAAIREVKVRFGEQLSKELEAAVHSAVGGSGKVASWQQGRFGSKGGYAAVSAITGSNGKYAYGYMTNSIDSGHVIRPPGKTKPRIHVAYVSGKGFYKAASAQADSIASSVAEELAENVANVLSE